MSVRKNTSVIWHHFNKDTQTLKATCNECKDVLSYKSSSANLKSHLRRKHPSTYLSVFGANDQSSSTQKQPDQDENRSRKQVEPIPGTSGSSVVSHSSLAPTAPPPTKRQKVMDSFINKKISVEQKKQIDSDLLDLCIDSFHPFSIVEERAFKKFCRWIPGYTLPTRKTLSGSLLEECYNKVENHVRSVVAQEVETICITTDLWTSRVTESYIAVTGHYITQDLELKTVLLGCCRFSGSHTALNIASELEIILNRWNLKEKVNFAVSDNAANVVKGIKEHLGIEHFGCFAHTLNLIVDDALELQQGLIDNIKKIVAHFKRSTVSSERLAKYQIQQNLQPKRLIQQVETRWNSVFYMIERIVELQDAVRSTLALVDRNLPLLSSEDWTTCAQLCQILRPFEEMTKAMSGEKYLTGSSVIIMVRCLKESCKKILGNTEFVSSVRDVAFNLQLGLEERFQRVEQSGTLALNTFLDPRFKTQAFSDTNEAAKTKERVRKLVAAQIAKHQTNPTPSKSSTEKKTDDYSPWDIFDGLINQNESSATPLSKAIKEVDMYLADDILLRRNASGEWNSPFVWWKNHRHV
ncbi:unnamed protein product [Danaus chrysippus]|uniref:(African queen) hypothetical protein n=1 Tax=Danaus chrysippus TaxID=151541 RepID=A0A8J2W5B3_9NEOP|nr:unnamed protein product [Danaus chrysippus]